MGRWYFRLRLRILGSPTRNPLIVLRSSQGLSSSRQWPFSSSSALMGLSDIICCCLPSIRVTPPISPGTEACLGPVPTSTPPGCHLFMAVPFYPGQPTDPLRPPVLNLSALFLERHILCKSNGNDSHFLKLNFFYFIKNKEIFQKIHWQDCFIIIILFHALLFLLFYSAFIIQAPPPPPKPLPSSAYIFYILMTVIHNCTFLKYKNNTHI